MSIKKIFENNISGLSVADLEYPKDFSLSMLDDTNKLTLNPGELETLKHVRAIDIVENHKLTSFKGLPMDVERLSFGRNNVKSFEGISANIRTLRWYFPQIKSLHNIHKYINSAEYIYLLDGEWSSSCLGLLKIKGLKSVQFVSSMIKSDNKYMPIHLELQKIINRHLRGTKDLLECQQELIDGGFEEYAQL